VGTTNKLTVKAIKNAKVGKKIADGGGLYLEVTKDGTAYFRMKFRHGGRESRLSFGNAAVVSLEEARRKRDEARALIRDGKNPSSERKAKRTAQRIDREAGFRNVAAGWLAYKSKTWAPATYRKAEFVVDSYLIPAFRGHSVATLTTKEAVDLLEAIAAKAPTLAEKARQYLASIVNFAIRHGLRPDGTQLWLRGAVPSYQKGNIPAATDAKEIAALIRAIDVYPTPVMRGALTLAMLTAVRPGCVAAARWQDIDLDAAEWRIPAEMMKMRHAHVVPLPRQAVAMLRVMQAYTLGHTYVFPPLARQKNEHLNRDAMSNALRRMGFQGRHATHGFRGMLRTVAREKLRVDSDVLEAQLAHAKKGEVQKAYDRTTFNEERRIVMQKWADYLDGLRSGGNVVPFDTVRRGAA
jgi:integrase